PGFRCIILSLLLGLPGCAIFETGPERFQDAEIRRQLAGLETWRMDGRVGVRSEDESWHAGLVWSHDRDVDRLYLSGPFGQGALNIKVSEHYIRVASADGTVEESGDPEQLLESMIGFAVPVPALRYWLLGLSYPFAESHSEYDRLGRLIKLNQLGWVAEYQDYQTNQRWSVPRKLSVVNKSTRLKLVIDDWQFPEKGY
ncbi:MAG: lipoprotein insertase outer membrane protein LolB, partial [Methylococcaceae bacterium]|nr:lipoprotein insertase outer membrane protein LolB [Methylococcaceae bacterium]